LNNRLLLLIAVAAAACGGGSDSASNGPTSPSSSGRTSVALIASASTLQPLQAATLTFPSPAGAAGAALAAKLGTTAVQVVLTDSITGTFLTPDVPAANYTLTVDFGSTWRGTATLRVTAAPAIADAKTEVTTSIAPLTKSVDSLVAALESAPLDSTTLTADQVAWLKDQSASLKAALASASTADLRAVALWLRANPNVISSATAALAPTRAPLAALTADQISSAVDAYISEYNQRVIAAGITIGGCVAGIPVAGVATAGPGAAVIAVVCGTLIGWQATGIADMVTKKLSSLYAIVDQLNIDLSSGSGSKAALPIGFASATGPSASVAVDPGVATHLTATARLRTITSSDRALVGGLFSAWDRVQALFTPLFSAVPKLASFNFGPANYAQYETASVAGSDIAVSASGCTSAPDGDGILLTCTQVDGNSDVSVIGNFTYTNRYGSTTATVPITVRRTWAAVGTPAVVLLERVSPWSTDGNGNLLVSCYFDMTMSVQGNTPITFTRWDGEWVAGWPTNYTEGADVNFTVDPRENDGVKWWDHQLVTGRLPSTSGPSFYVNYTIKYTIAATGQTGSVQTVAFCQ
jgi:hypothetical protein